MALSLLRHGRRAVGGTRSLVSRFHHQNPQIIPHSTRKLTQSPPFAPESTGIKRPHLCCPGTCVDLSHISPHSSSSPTIHSHPISRTFFSLPPTTPIMKSSLPITAALMSRYASIRAPAWIPKINSTTVSSPLTPTPHPPHSPPTVASSSQRISR